MVRFGIQGSGIKFEAKHQWKRWGEVDNWVCAYQPILNTVIYDCLPENQVHRHRVTLLVKLRQGSKGSP